MEYIETRIISAEPQEKDGRQGYLVCHPDGYISWSQKETFEASCLPVTRDEKTYLPKVTSEMVRNFIAYTDAITLSKKTTAVRAVLRNGFEIIQSSSCVSPENYDQQVGEQLCVEKIEDKVSELLGFLLQTAVHGI